MNKAFIEYLKLPAPLSVLIKTKQVEAKQGKHPVNYRKKLPLGNAKLKKITT